mmetsp:Transcript_15545/g.46112  ORF Transcript_15545/g.46112 Transcript_15545/m.46112 type:complete len:220 (-) Transcript_15545:266-925(-)
MSGCVPPLSRLGQSSSRPMPFKFLHNDFSKRARVRSRCHSLIVSSSLSPAWSGGSHSCQTALMKPMYVSSSFRSSACSDSWEFAGSSCSNFLCNIPKRATLPFFSATSLTSDSASAVSSASGSGSAGSCAPDGGVPGSCPPDVTTQGRRTLMGERWSFDGLSASAAPNRPPDLLPHAYAKVSVESRDLTSAIECAWPATSFSTVPCKPHWSFARVGCVT